MRISDKPAPTTFLPYARQSINEQDIAAVCEVLRSDYLTTGPKVAEFEEGIARFVGADHAVAVASGTAALHSAMYAIGIGPGDEVIVPPITFCATANSILYQGAIPVFADVCADTLLIDPGEIEKKITPRTRAIIAVDYAGQPCDYDDLRTVADKYGLVVVADSCHALGAEYRGRRLGSIADLTVFSFHPVKHIATGEGGMVTTSNVRWAERMRRFRNHGITTDHNQRAKKGQWFYEMTDLGYNYRITDIQCALGISQLNRLSAWVSRRNEIAEKYDRAFARIKGVTPLVRKPDRVHAYHLYVIRLDLESCGCNRDELFKHLRNHGIGTQVHYIPVYLHPYYREKFNTAHGDCPVSEEAARSILSLPMFPAMSDDEQEVVVETIKNVNTENIKLL